MLHATDFNVQRFQYTKTISYIIYIGLSPVTTYQSLKEQLVNIITISRLSVHGFMTAVKIEYRTV